MELRRKFAFCVAAFAATIFARGSDGSWNGVAFTAWNGVNIAAFNNTAVSSLAFLINEGFDGAGTPSGWSAGAIDFDYTTSPLRGTQSASVGADGFNTSSFAGQSQFDLRMLVRWTTLPGSATEVMAINDAGSATVVGWGVDASGHLVIWDGPAEAHTASSSGTMSSGVDYVIWIHSTAGTGANQVITGEFVAKSSGVRTGSGSGFCTITDGAAQNNATFYAAVYGGFVFVIDDLKVVSGATKIGDYK